MSHEPRPQAALSVIVITPDDYDTVRGIVRCLARQTVRDRLELVFVVPRAENFGLRERDLQPFASHQVIAIGPLQSTARARAAGVRAASTPLVAFVEDHCFPSPEWAGMLIAAHDGPWVGVGPVVRNANPAHLLSWANLLIEYGPWLDPTDGGARSHIPGHNSSYKREALLPYGDDLGDRLEAESTLQWDLAARGARFALEPRAVVSHQNVTGVKVSLAMRFHCGRLFAATRAREWSWTRRAAYACGSPLIPVVRFARTLKDARRAAPPPRRLTLLPLVAGLLAVDGLGELAGYATGSGRAMTRLAELEFHRHRFITPADRRAADVYG